MLSATLRPSSTLSRINDNVEEYYIDDVEGHGLRARRNIDIGVKLIDSDPNLSIYTGMTEEEWEVKQQEWWNHELEKASNNSGRIHDCFEQLRKSDPNVWARIRRLAIAPILSANATESEKDVARCRINAFTVIHAGEKKGDPESRLTCLSEYQQSQSQLPPECDDLQLAIQRRGSPSIRQENTQGLTDHDRLH